MRHPAPRSVRGRLVATCALVAVLLAAAGLVVFGVVLQRGLSRSLDASLQARAAPLIAALNDPTTPGLPDLPDSSPSAGPAPRPGIPGAPPASDTLTGAYRPDGRIVAIDPPVLVASPLDAGQLQAARRRGGQVTIGAGERSLRVLTVPVRRPDGVWVVVVGANADLTADAAATAATELLVAVPLLILAAVAGAWLLSGAALRPVERLRVEAEELGAHDPAGRLGVPDTADELARLATTFNGLLDWLQRSLIRQQDLVADAGHELRTPLAVLRTELDLADRSTRSRDELADAVAHARVEVERLSMLADGMLFLARADSHVPLNPEWTDVASVATQVVRATEAEANRRQVRVTVSTGASAPTGKPAAAWVDPAALRRALDNLVANAMRVAPPGSTVCVMGRQLAGETIVEVIDTGPGFDPAFLPHAFERFRRADSARRSGDGGAGLGLAIVAEIARAHAGRAEAANRPDGGAAVRLALPHPGVRP